MASVMDFVNQLEKLPPLPGTLIRISNMAADGDASIDELSDIIRSDEALTAGVLRAANSALYGASGKTFDLKQSIIRLGIRNLLNLLAQEKAGELFGAAGSSYGLRRGDLWRSSISGAIGAEMLAKQHGFAEPSLCYVAGLLRDVGKIVIDLAATQQDIDRIEVLADTERPFTECEQEVFGADHAEVGAALAQRWNLPEQIVDAIRYHHEPPLIDTEEHDTLFDIVHAGDVLTLWAGFSTGTDGLLYTLSPHVRESLSLTRRTAEASIASMVDRLLELEEAVTPTFRVGKTA